MTQAEMQVEVESLREQLSQMQQQQESRDKQLRLHGLINSISDILYVVIGAGFLLATFYLDLAKSQPMTQQYLFIIGIMFIITSTPIPLFSQALRSK